mgnify:CR=1 FL=1
MVGRPLPPAMSAGEDDEWRFSLEDVEEREAEEPAESGGNVAGSFLPDKDIEPGDVDLENALFVALGVVIAALVLLGFVLALT